MVDRITLVSLDADGNPIVGGLAFDQAVSADGRHVVFNGSDGTLLPEGGGTRSNIFLRDLEAGTTTLVNVATDGTPADQNSYSPVISDDGGTVAFESFAGNLVPDDPDRFNGDVAVRDLEAGTTVLASLPGDGLQANDYSTGPSISADGRLVVFDASDVRPDDNSPDGASDVFVRDLTSGVISRVNVALDGGEANAFSFGSAISADGRFVAFGSGATNLVAGDANGVSDVFLRDLQTGTTTRVSLAADGAEADGGSFLSTFSPNGRLIAFVSDAENLVPDDSNGRTDLFVRDLATDAVIRADVAADGRGANGSVSSAASFSADGRFVAFSSQASNLVPGDTNRQSDVFVKDLETGAITRANVAADGAEVRGSAPGAGSFAPSLTADGGTVVFSGNQAGLVPEDNDASSNVFAAPVVFAEPPPPGESYVGTNGADDRAGGAGDDRLEGRGGDDALDGAGGDDVLAGDGALVTVELRARAAAFDDAFGWYDRDTGEGQLLDRRLAADGDPATAEASYVLAVDGAKLASGDIQFFLVPDGDRTLARDRLPIGPGDTVPVRVTDDDRVELADGSYAFRGRFADAYFTEDAHNPDGEPRAFPLDLDGEAPGDLVWEDGRDDDRNDVALAVRAAGGNTGTAGNDTLSGGGGADVLLGGPGNDRLAGDDGDDRLEGGTGTDRFVYAAPGEGVDRIIDFAPGAGGDVLDLGALLDGLGYAGSDPLADGVLRTEAAGRDARVVVDADGAAGPGSGVTLALLLGVTPGQLDPTANLDPGG